MSITSVTCLSHRKSERRKSGTCQSHVRAVEGMVQASRTCGDNVRYTTEAAERHAGGEGTIVEEGNDALL